MRNFGVLIFLLFTSACASSVSDAGYYWGNYSKTSYLLVSEPSDESLQIHLEGLEKIVEESKDRELRVPPGIYAEIGYALTKLGRENEAARFFHMERQLYPESAPFLDAVVQGNNQEEG